MTSTDNGTREVSTMIQSRTGFMVVTLLILFSCCLAGGCLSVLSQSGNGETGPGSGGSGLRATLINQDTDWGFSRGCVWTTTFQVSNQGNTTVQGVTLHLELVNAKNGAVRDTKEIYMGTIAPGESKEARITLDGECLDEYTVRAFPAVSGL